jgi:hypothetical protein
MYCFTSPLQFNESNEHTHRLSSEFQQTTDIFDTIYRPLLFETTTTSLTPYQLQIAHALFHSYSSDSIAIKNMQQLLKSTLKYTHSIRRYAESAQNIEQSWFDLQTLNQFSQTYQFIDFPILAHFNTNTDFMMIKGWMTLLSPITALLLPVITIIFTCIALYTQGHGVNLYHLCTTAMCESSIGQLLTQFKTTNITNLLYLALTAGFYLLSMYQNILSSYQYYQNLSKIQSYLEQTQSLVENSIQVSNQMFSSNSTSFFLHKTKKRAKHFTLLQQHLHSHILPTLQNILEEIKDTSNHMGKTMTLFYKLKHETKYVEVIDFAIGFGHYLGCIHRVASNPSLHFCKITKKQQLTSTNIFYPAHLFDSASHTQIVKNNIDLTSQNIILSGPNASGKTTLLKTVFVNLLLSQQFGKGCYSSMHFQPFTHFHSYLNIPDTSGRDSLFQAEAKRCKQIIDSIENNQHKKHFCIFDELFSGTNPEEATQCAIAFITYLNNKQHQTSFLLTTHFHQLCKEIQTLNLKHTSNFQMNKMHCLEEGISTTKNGCETLKQLNFPTSMIQSINSTKNTN